ncbi:MAG: hypothetical protein Q8L53_16855 [Aestuariivirga sp.]|nr:hypothetical protein [Aestuariivirga sp.]
MNISIHSIDRKQRVVASVTSVPLGSDGPFCCITLDFPEHRENCISFYLPEKDLDKARELARQWNDLSIAQAQS